MAITRTPMIDDDGSGTTGTVINAAWKTEFYDQIDAALVAVSGPWTTVPFNAANFVGSGGMTWTVASGNIQTNKYTLIGKTLIWALTIEGSTLGGTADAQISATIPGGHYVPSRADGPATARLASGALTPVLLYVLPAANNLLNIRYEPSFPLGSIAIFLTFAFEVS